MATPLVGVPFVAGPPPLFPSAALRGLTLEMKRTFEYASVVSKAASGRENVATWQEMPIIHFELNIDWLPDDPNLAAEQLPLGSTQFPFTDYETLVGFFQFVRGQFAPFYLRLADLTQKDADSTLTGQLVGTGDGTTKYFQLSRSMGSTYEPVQNVDVNSPINIYLNGSPLLTGWAINTLGVLIFASNAPSAGVTITADFSYFYLCRFDEETLEIDQTLINLNDVQTLKMRTIIS
jgi:uncharacterized protein (TIGR02217 family)